MKLPRLGAPQFAYPFTHGRRPLGASRSWRLRPQLPQTPTGRFSCGHRCSVRLSKYQGAGSLGRTVSFCRVSQETARLSCEVAVWDSLKHQDIPTGKDKKGGQLPGGKAVQGEAQSHQDDLSPAPLSFEAGGFLQGRARPACLPHPARMSPRRAGPGPMSESPPTEGKPSAHTQ